MYKMVNITKDTFENNDIEAIVDSVNALWLNEKNIEEKLGHKNLPVVTNKYGKIHKKDRYELVDKPIKQPNRRFLQIDLASKIIMDCRADKSCSLKKNLSFKLHDVINTKEQAIINSIKATFEEENIQTQYSVLGYRIEIKPIKVGKQSGTTYCFGCKDYTKNFRSQEVKVTNKVLRDKSHCVVCRSNKSRFLKQKIN